MNNQLKAILAGAFILLVTLLLLSKCSSCRDQRQEIAQTPPPEQPVPPQPEEEPEQEPEQDVADIGGTGDLKIVLTWEYPGDIDIHVTQPSGHVIYYGDKIDPRTGGNLDVDNMDGGRPGRPAAENVYWPQPPSGRYHVMVKFFGSRVGGENGGPVKVTVFNNGERSEYEVNLNTVGQEVDVVDIDYTPRSQNQQMQR